MKSTAIYGLFDLAGTCHYIGQTVDVAGRRRKHWAGNRQLLFKVLAQCEPVRADEVEIALIQKLKARGECGLNRSLAKARVFAKKPLGDRLCWVETGRVFSGRLEAAQYFGVCRGTVANALKHWQGRLDYPPDDCHDKPKVTLKPITISETAISKIYS